LLFEDETLTLMTVRALVFMASKDKNKQMKEVLKNILRNKIFGDALRLTIIPMFDQNTFKLPNDYRLMQIPYNLRNLEDYELNDLIETEKLILMSDKTFIFKTSTFQFKKKFNIPIGLDYREMGDNRIIKEGITNVQINPNIIIALLGGSIFFVFSKS